MDMLFLATMDISTRFWGFQLEGYGIRVHGHILFFFKFNMDHVLTCRCSADLPFYTVDLVPFGIIFTENYFIS